MGYVKQNYSFIKTVKYGLNVSQYSQENIFTRKSFLINIVEAGNLSRSLFRKSIVIRKVDQVSITNLITQFLPRQDFCISAQFLVTTSYI